MLSVLQKTEVECALNDCSANAGCTMCCCQQRWHTHGRGVRRGKTVCERGERPIQGARALEQELWHVRIQTASPYLQPNCLSV
jgi:hypothetical protein